MQSLWAEDDGTSTWFTGTVSKYHPDNRAFPFLIKYTDGDTERARFDLDLTHMDTWDSEEEEEGRREVRWPGEMPVLAFDKGPPLKQKREALPSTSGGAGSSAEHAGPTKTSATASKKATPVSAAETSCKAITSKTSRSINAPLLASKAEVREPASKEVAAAPEKRKPGRPRKNPLSQPPAKDSAIAPVISQAEAAIAAAAMPPKMMTTAAAGQKHPLQQRRVILAAPPAKDSPPPQSVGRNASSAGGSVSGAAPSKSLPLGRPDQMGQRGGIDSAVATAATKGTGSEAAPTQAGKRPSDGPKGDRLPPQPSAHSGRGPPGSGSGGSALGGPVSTGPGRPSSAGVSSAKVPGVAALAATTARDTPSPGSKSQQPPARASLPSSIKSTGTLDKSQGLQPSRLPATLGRGGGSNGAGGGLKPPAMSSSPLAAAKHPQTSPPVPPAQRPMPGTPPADLDIAASPTNPSLVSSPSLGLVAAGASPPAPTSRGGTSATTVDLSVQLQLAASGLLPGLDAASAMPRVTSSSALASLAASSTAPSHPLPSSTMLGKLTSKTLLPAKAPPPPASESHGILDLNKSLEEMTRAAQTIKAAAGKACDAAKV